MSRQPTIAYLGMGMMGSAMALNFAKAGCSVTVWNRSPERALAMKQSSICVAESVDEAVGEAQYIFSCLGDVPDVEEVLLGKVLGKAPKNAVVIDMTTIGQSAARSLDKALTSAGLRFLDAPVTGGDVGARNGTLTILVGGERATFDEVLPLFEKIGKNIVYCGACGSGQAVKLCNQVLCAINMVAVSESLLLAEEMAVDGKLIVEALGAGAGGSWALSNLGPRILKEDFGPGFTLEHMLKDLRLIHENVSACELPGTELAERLFKRAVNEEPQFGSRQGTQSMIRAYRKSKSSQSCGSK